MIESSHPEIHGAEAVKFANSQLLEDGANSDPGETEDVAASQREAWQIREATKMALDYYVETQGLIDALTRQGYVDDANGLKGAIEGGATANEILMAIRWGLQEFQRARHPVDAHTKK